MTEIGIVLASKYKVLAKLGEGGMGSVFRAENLLTGKQVAIKCLHRHVTANQVGTERLLREARASARLSHPNVVDIYDVVSDGETTFLVMELLRGETLRSYLRRHPQLKICEFIAVLLPALAGVAAAHECGVIHRDLKPDNIFVSQLAAMSSPVVKVLDFGIAKLAMTSGPTLTQTGVALGTPLYMPLEQLRGDKDIDERADVYAFGVMLYEAITGSRPYEADTLPELALKVATTDPLEVTALRPDVPTPLAKIIDWALARERNQRLPSISTLLQELELFARERSFRQQMTNPEAPLPLLASGQGTADTPRVASHGRASLTPPVERAQPLDPDTLRARELVGATRSRHTRARIALVAAALGSALITLASLLWLRPKPQTTTTADGATASSHARAETNAGSSAAAMPASPLGAAHTTAIPQPGDAIDVRAVAGSLAPSLSVSAPEVETAVEPGASPPASVAAEPVKQVAGPDALPPPKTDRLRANQVHPQPASARRSVPSHTNAAPSPSTPTTPAKLDPTPQATPTPTQKSSLDLVGF